jgi:hypothetical protein
MEEETKAILSNIVKTHADVKINNASFTVGGHTTYGWACYIDLGPMDVIQAEAEHGDVEITPSNTQSYEISAFDADLDVAVRRAANSYFAARAASETEATA